MLQRSLREFHLSSPLRDGVLCWYPFKRNADILDLSGGALTDLLSSRCDRVKTDENGNSFDYVVILDPNDFSVDALKTLHGKLNSHGRLLLAYENPFAMRYWSGKKSPKTGIPYDPLFGRDGRPSKAELKIRMRLAGFKGLKWYYPLTDHWFAKEIYSEDYLPDEFLKHRFVPYIDGDEFLQFDERGLYYELIRGGAFEFMCGAYLVEARVCESDPACPVDYAAVTAYRDESKRFATSVRNDGQVWKTPLHPSGEDKVADIMRNHKELSGMGIDIIQTDMKDGHLIMPRLNLPTLWDYWARKLIDGTFNENEMYVQFDKIRDAIYKAAAGGKCFWELVPANCFYDEETGRLIFFDQEYCWEGVRPEVALVRAVWALIYSPVFKVNERMKTCLEGLKLRYGLSEKWDELSELADQKTFEEVFGKSGSILEDRYDRFSNQLYIYSLDCADLIRRLQRFKPLPEKLRSMGLVNPVIYGYGRRGNTLEHVLRSFGIEPVAIVDRGINMYQSIELMPSNIVADVVIVSMLEGEPMKNELKKRVAIPVFTLEELLNECAE